MRLGVVLSLLVMVAGCAPAERERPISDLVFLTRDGCVNTPVMRSRLDAALTALGKPLTYGVIDAGTLPESDARGGYGTPTVLVDGKDVFGLTEPPVPHPPPT